MKASSLAENNMTTGMQPRDKWIPWYFVAFFVVLAILDGIFVYLAVSTQTGVVTEHSYQKGRDYNNVIAEVEQQEALAWHAEIAFDKASGQVTAALTDKTGQAISHADVTAYFSRPTQAGYDFSEELTAQGNGYSKAVTFPLQGQWDVTIVAKDGDATYQQRERIIVE